MTNNVPFNDEDREIRVYTLDGELWFALGDVCRQLGLALPHRVATHLDEADRRTVTVRSGGQNRDVTVINGSGLCDVLQRFLDGTYAIAE